MGVGLFFGLYPARKAAAMNIIDAHRDGEGDRHADADTGTSTRRRRRRG